MGCCGFFDSRRVTTATEQNASSIAWRFVITPKIAESLLENKSYEGLAEAIIIAVERAMQFYHLQNSAPIYNQFRAMFSKEDGPGYAARYLKIFTDNMQNINAIQEKEIRNSLLTQRKDSLKIGLEKAIEVIKHVLNECSLNAFSRVKPGSRADHLIRQLVLTSLLPHTHASSTTRQALKAHNEFIENANAAGQILAKIGIQMNPEEIKNLEKQYGNPEGDLPDAIESFVNQHVKTPSFLIK